MAPTHFNRLRVKSALPPAIILPQNFKLDDDIQYDPITTRTIKRAVHGGGTVGPCLYSFRAAELKLLRPILFFSFSYQPPIKRSLLEALIWKD